MIFDWIANSERILKEGKITDDTESDGVRSWTQETRLLQYLIFDKDLGRDECYEIWKNISGGTYDLLRYPVDGDKESQDPRFIEQWKKAFEFGPLRPLPPAPIYREEVDFLNGLEAPLSVRKFWVRLLVYVKTKRALREIPVKKHIVDAALARSAGVPARSDDAARLIQRWSLKCGIPFPVTVVGRGKWTAPAYDPKWVGGTEIVGRFILGEFDGIDDLLVDATFTCPSCGSLFERAPRAKTDLCPDCQKEKDLSDQRAYRKRTYKSRKNVE